MKVLVIDSDRVLGRATTDFLAGKGYDTLLKTSAQTGIDGVDELNPDAIVLELQLDKHNGIEFLHELRSYGDCQNVPVILYTSNKNALGKEFTKGWRQLGVNNILYKPEANLDTLLSTLKSIK